MDRASQVAAPVKTDELFPRQQCHIPRDCAFCERSQEIHMSILSTPNKLSYAGFFFIINDDFKLVIIHFSSVHNVNNITEEHCNIGKNIDAIRVSLRCSN